MSRVRAREATGDGHPSPPRNHRLVRAEVLHRLPTALAHLLTLLLEAIDDAPFAGLNRGTMLFDVRLALGRAVRERHHRAFESHGRIVERVVAAHGELVLVGVEAGEQAPLTGRDALAMRIELRFAALFHLISERHLTRCRRDR